MISRGDDGRKSALFVHKKGVPATYDALQFDPELVNCEVMLKIDEGTGAQIVESASTGAISFQGYGVAVLTNQAAVTDETGRILTERGSL